MNLTLVFIFSSFSFELSGDGLAGFYGLLVLIRAKRKVSGNLIRDALSFRDSITRKSI